MDDTEMMEASKKETTTPRRRRGRTKSSPPKTETTTDNDNMEIDEKEEPSKDSSNQSVAKKEEQSSSDAAPSKGEIPKTEDLASMDTADSNMADADQETTSQSPLKTEPAEGLSKTKDSVMNPEKEGETDAGAAGMMKAETEPSPPVHDQEEQASTPIVGKRRRRSKSAGTPKQIPAANIRAKRTKKQTVPFQPVDFKKQRNKVEIKSEEPETEQNKPEEESPTNEDPEKEEDEQGEKDASKEEDPEEEKDDKDDSDEDFQKEETGESEEEDDGEEEEEESMPADKKRRSRGRSEEPRSATTDDRAKRARRIPTDIYHPVDFNVSPRAKRAAGGRSNQRAKSLPKTKPKPLPGKKTNKDYVKIIEGQGIKLGKIPIIRKTVQETDMTSQKLYLVHRFLYSYRGRGSCKLYKAHILEYSGYMRKAREGENENKVDKENRDAEIHISTKAFKLSLGNLKTIMDFFHIDREPKTPEDPPLNKDALIDRLLDFLSGPSEELMNPISDTESGSGEDDDDEDDEKSGEEEKAEGSKDSEKATSDGASTEKATKSKAAEGDKKDSEAAEKSESSVAGEPKKEESRVSTDSKVTETKKKDGVDSSESDQVHMDDGDKVTGTESKQDDTAKAMETEPKKADTKTPDKQETEGGKDDTATTGTAKLEAPKQGETKKDPSAIGQKDQVIPPKIPSNSQTYQEWCRKARIEGAFYLVREHVKGRQPSDAALRQWVQAYVACTELTTVTARDAIDSASQKFGVDLWGRRELIKQFLVSEM